MMMNKKSYLKGSEWRKWDLHVHTPESQGFSGDWQQFIIQLGNADCDVIGINDYFSVAGYMEIMRLLNEPVSTTEGNKPYREALEKLHSKTLFPVVECRMNNVLLNKDTKSGPRLNFHVIFDPSVAADVESFIKNLDVNGSSIAGRYADKKFLLDDVQVNITEVCKKLRQDGNFKDKFIIWIPYDEYGGIDAIDPASNAYFKQGLIREADILGSANKAQSDFFLWRHNKYTSEQFKEWFSKKKPCIKGSDSHNVNDELGKLKDEKSQPTNKYCWIKADPTFNGLRQIINEPEDRVFIGLIPPKVEEVKNNSTRYLSSITIKKMSAADIDDEWFDCEFPLNSDMVSIIGNKGSGKSALADILALAGNAHCDPINFSFLTKDRFCEKNGRIAKNYEVVSTWADGTATTTPLNSKPDLNSVELVKYIPQSYLEKVCTESVPGEKSEFQSELRKVIFSHIPDADRLEKETLEDLIDYKTEELRTQIMQFRQEIERLNIDICKFETKTTPEHLAQLQSSLKLKQKELDAHIANKPEVVVQPSNATDEQKAANQAIQNQLEEERKNLAVIEMQILEQQSKQKNLADQIATSQKLQGKVDNFKSDYDRLINDTALDVSKLGLDVSKIVALSIDKTSLTEKQTALAADKSIVDNALAETGDASLLIKKDDIQARIKMQQDKLDAPNKIYQTYTQALQNWEQGKKNIEGSQDKPEPNTINYFQAQVKYVQEQVPVEIERLEVQRKEVSKKIYKAINSVRNVFVELFKAVQELIEGSIIIKEGFKLTFDSSIIEKDFQLEFFEKYISQGVSGSFCNKEKGALILEEICDDFDFDKEEDALRFIERITDYLRYDKRTAQNGKMSIESQLRKHIETKDLYDYLWSLEYLKPEYSLKLDSKDLSHLSPGERGTLLLVFYLLVDKSNKPIIVDQPEENLDSQTVYRLLIPVIKEVKKRRQIIMVTHSPNIAVVCDAEQIIHSVIDRANKNKVIYTSGAIEAPEINGYLIDILEGTRPAFNNRQSKYN
jgi:ABC-type lipoprotein export system ATPase subunit